MKNRLPLIELSGTPRRMGELFGEACREQTRELFDCRMQAAISFAIVHGRRRFECQQVLDIAGQCLPITEQYDPAGYEEFVGIARGAGLTPAELFVTNGLTDLRDVLAFSSDVTPSPAAIKAPGGEGCSSFIVASDRAANGNLLLGQTWDLIADNLPFVMLVRRKPVHGPSTLSLTLTGCLTLIGMNSEGLAVGNTNLRTHDARIGLQYLSILHKAINSRSLDDAAHAVENAPRSAAHYYYLADASGRAMGLECSATRCHRFVVDSGVFVHCNHALDGSIGDLECKNAIDRSTCARQPRLATLLAAHTSAIDVQHMRANLSDHHGGDDAICRHAAMPTDVGTNAAVIMSPRTREFHACKAQPCIGSWVSHCV